MAIKLTLTHKNVTVKKALFLKIYFWIKESWITFLYILSSVQLLSCVWLFVTPWTTAHQAFLSITNSRSLPQLMSIESVMPSNHLILCHTLLLLPSIFPNIRVFSNESVLCIRWPKYWSFSFGISPSNEYSGWICFLIFHTGTFKLRDACGICWRSHCLVILKNPIQILALNLLAFYPPTHLPS